MATKPTVTIGEATKKDDYDNLVDFVAANEQNDAPTGITLVVADAGTFVTIDAAGAWA